MNLKEQMKERLFCGARPNAITWADRLTDVDGDYQHWAALYFHDLSIRFETSCPHEFRIMIEMDSYQYILRRGGSFDTSECGQPITLGYKLPKLLDWSTVCHWGMMSHYAGGPFALWEITEESYWWGLECVPPTAWNPNDQAFLNGEPSIHRAGRGFYTFACSPFKDQYFAGPLITTKRFKTVTRSEILTAIGLGRSAS